MGARVGGLDGRVVAVISERDDLDEAVVRELLGAGATVEVVASSGAPDGGSGPVPSRRPSQHPVGARVADLADGAGDRALIASLAAERGGLDAMVTLGLACPRVRDLVRAALPLLRASSRPTVVTLAVDPARTADDEDSATADALAAAGVTTHVLDAGRGRPDELAARIVESVASPREH